MGTDLRKLPAETAEVPEGKQEALSEVTVEFYSDTNYEVDV